jgi:archaemetzincin
MQRPAKKDRLAALGVDLSAIPPHLRETPDFPAVPSFQEGIDNDPQDFAEFYSFDERAKVLPTRRTLYLVPLGLQAAALAPHGGGGPPLPALATMGAFLTAFTGLPHKLLPALPLVPWTGKGKGKGGGGGGRKRKAPGAGGFTAVRTASSLVRVREGAPGDGEFASALHCHDLLDALLEELPGDAFAILGFTAHDIHEDGMPVGGRAFGGSRIAVISLARYHPVFDDVTTEWPAWGGRGGACLQAARAAATAAAAANPPPATPAVLTALWAQRVAVTAMHELGHCLGLDHCIYYSCFMGENEGQAPYACPVCLRKLLCAVGGDALPCADAAPALRHYASLQAFCAAPEQRVSPYWAALGAWCGGRLAELGGGAPGAGPSGAGAGAAGGGSGGGAGAGGGASGGGGGCAGQ